MKKIIAVITVCFIIISMFSGCALLQKLGLQGDDELQPASSVVIGEEDAKKLNDTVPIRLYFADENNAKLKLQVRYLPVSEAKKSTNHLAKVIMNELLEGPGKDSPLKAVIPAGTRLLSDISIQSGVATVNLSQEFVDKHPGGKVAEELTIYSIVNSLTELKEIQKVKFQINGASRSEYKGNFKFDNPFPRTVSIITSDTSSPADATASPVKQEASQESGESKDSVQDKGTPAPNEATVDSDAAYDGLLEGEVLE